MHRGPCNVFNRGARARAVEDAAAGDEARSQAPAVSGRGLGWQDARVLAADRLSDSNVVLRLEPAAGRAVVFRPGQFVYVQHQVPGGPPLKAPYSIASPPAEKRYLELCVKKVADGPMSSWLYDRNVGDHMMVSRAFGGFHFASAAGTTVVFLATGTGIAPFRSMLLDQLERGRTDPLWLYYGVGREVNLVYAREFEALARQHTTFHFVPVVSRAQPSWMGERGWVQEPFLRDFQDRRDFDVYVCGVKVMVDDVIQLLRSRGVPDHRIYFEKYV